jgi:hypothetical protein
VEFALQCGAKVIVFENLKSLRSEEGTKSHYFNQKPGHWMRVFGYPGRAHFPAVSAVWAGQVHGVQKSKRDECGLFGHEQHL